MTDTQIAITEETREELQWVKLLSMSGSYDQAIRRLIEDSGFEVPDEAPSEGGWRRLVVDGGSGR